uniref:Transcription repressor n=1 Tax=Salix viminalis TaxID=40686 RepID=A0A6N2MSI3_SALVM
MSTDKKRFLLNIVSVSLGCSSCRKQKLSSVCQPKQKLQAPTYQKHKKDLYSSSSSLFVNLFIPLVYYSSYNQDKAYMLSFNTSSKITAKQSPNGHENHDTSNIFSPTVDNTPSHFFSDSGSSMRHCSGAVRGFGRVGDESVAVEKDSDDPYLDFRHSMLQMILEKQLLDCFLQLNSPYYHGVIIKAFTEIWNGVFSMRSNTTTGAEKQLT